MADWLYIAHVLFVWLPFVVSFNATYMLISQLVSNNKHISLAWLNPAHFCLAWSILKLFQLFTSLKSINLISSCYWNFLQSTILFPYASTPLKFKFSKKVTNIFLTLLKVLAVAMYLGFFSQLASAKLKLPHHSLPLNWPRFQVTKYSQTR